MTNKGSSATVELALGDADLDELKRLDNLAMNASTSHVAWLSYTFLDRSALENPILAAAAAVRVDAFTPDTTAPTLEAYVVNMQARTLTFTFDEPVVVATFNEPVASAARRMIAAARVARQSCCEGKPSGVICWEASSSGDARNGAP